LEIQTNILTTLLPMIIPIGANTTKTIGRATVNIHRGARIVHKAGGIIL
jgi:hypothetical protein